jgi:hypothetical protein
LITSRQSLYDLSGQINMILKRSEQAYKEYLLAGKTFMYARILRRYNKKLRSLLIKEGHSLPSYLQKDALELIAHYDIWIEKWDMLQLQLNPKPDDLFVFPNEVTFPKDAACKLEEFWQLLNKPEDIANESI